MMEMDWNHRRLEPVEVYNLFHKHNLLPAVSEVELLATMRHIALHAEFGIVTDGQGAVLASAFTIPSRRGVKEFTWIPEIKLLHKLKDDLAALGEELRSVWFKHDTRRVEAYVPISRTQTTRALKGLGFRQETLDCGIRSFMDYGKGYEPHILLGMLETDPIKHIPIAQEEVANHG